MNREITRQQVEEMRYRVYRWAVLAKRIARIARTLEKQLIELEKRHRERNA